MRTLAAERSTAVHRGGPTIEDLVREEIRPLLKDWLDTHLPRWSSGWCGPRSSASWGRG